MLKRMEHNICVCICLSVNTPTIINYITLKLVSLSIFPTTAPDLFHFLFNTFWHSFVGNFFVRKTLFVLNYQNKKKLENFYRNIFCARRKQQEQPQAQFNLIFPRKTREIEEKNPRKILLDNSMGYCKQVNLSQIIIPHSNLLQVLAFSI